MLILSRSEVISLSARDVIEAMLKHEIEYHVRGARTIHVCVSCIGVYADT